MTAAEKRVFLPDNDCIVGDLNEHLAREAGDEKRDCYWQMFEVLRTELGYVNYLCVLQRDRVGALNDPRLLSMSLLLVDYPFVERLYRGALDPANSVVYPDADITLAHIGELINLGFHTLPPDTGFTQQEKL